MNELASLCKDLKTRLSPKKQRPSQLVACWSEKDRFNEDIIDAFVIILRTRGCSWALQSGCSMCGYFNDSAWRHITETQLLDQFKQAMETYNQEPLVKIFTSGSFLDETEIPITARNQMISTLSSSAQKISVESRPEYITEHTLKDIKKQLESTSFEVGIGLETSNDLIREKTINKGFTYADYEHAATHLKDQGFLTKTYVLVKPPFLSESEAIDDSISTIETIADITNSVSLNPTNVQRHTLVEYLWKRQQYRPAWLWSVIEILKKSKETHPHLRLQCDVAGGGKPRGAHNCKHCDSSALKKIKQFSLTQETDVFSDLVCTCKTHWQNQLELEPLSFGSLIDTQRWQL